MLKRKFMKKPSSTLLQCSNRGSDIIKPDNTSLIVNESDSETDELPKEITSVLTEHDIIENVNRNSTSLMHSLTKKTQSTPAKHSSCNSVTEKEVNNRFVPGSGRNEKEGNLITQKEISYFEQVLKACGAISISGNSSYILSEDQTVFSLKVNEMLLENNNNISLFMNSLNTYIEEANNFQKMLALTLTSDDCDVARGPVQDPMMRLLLNVDCLQIQLLEVLIAKLGDIVLVCEDNKSSQMVCSVLRQMRFLNLGPHIKIAHKLFEVIQIAPINIQRDIIFMLPEVVPHREIKEISSKLVDMLKDENELTNVIVDTISSFFINDCFLSELRTKLIKRLDKCPIEYLPSLVQFILNKSEPEEYSWVMNDLRNSLPFTVKHKEMRKGNEKKADEETYITITFETLKFSVMTSKQMAETWLKIIASTNCPADFRCADLMMLIIMHSCLRGKKGQIVSLIRNKIGLSILTDAHVADLFKVLTIVVSEYFTTVLEIASVLLKSIQLDVVNFGALLYEECFKTFQFYVRQAVVNDILIHVGTGSPGTVNAALTVLRSLCKTHKEELNGHTVSIMGLLIKVTDLSPPQVRILMDIICDLVFFDSFETNSRWLDEMHIFIQKKVASPSVDVRKKAIITAVILAKHAGKNNNLPEIYLDQINCLLDALRASSGPTDNLGIFFNDEFAAMLLETKDLSEQFMSFWREKICSSVMKKLFVKDVDSECEYFSTSLQFGLDSNTKSSVSFPIVDFIKASNSNKSPEIPATVIPSALKLLWSYEETLESSVFSAPIKMPEITVFDAFQSLEEKNKKMLMDCLFLCVNYLIECVNAFCVHDVVDKALMRLKQLIKVRKNIRDHIVFLPDYEPPKCQLYSAAAKKSVTKMGAGIVSKKVTKRGKKRKREDADKSESPLNSSPVEDDVSEMAVDAMDESIPTEVNRAVGNKENEDPRLAGDGIFRNFHFDCIKLLSVDLNSKEKIFQNEGCLRFSSKLEMDTTDALFLLEDCNRKCKRLLSPVKGNIALRDNSSESYDEQMDHAEFIGIATKILPGLLLKMEFWSTQCRDLLRNNENVIDYPGMFIKVSRDFKVALAKGLEFIAEIVSWTGFRKQTNRSLLKAVLSVLSKKTISNGEKINSALIGSLAAEAARYLSTFIDAILILSGGINLIKAVQSCLSYSSSGKHQSLVGNLSLKILQKPWFNAFGVPETGSHFNKQVDLLVRTYFFSMENSLEAIRNAAILVGDEVHLLTGKKSSLNSFKTIYRNNFSILYKAICSVLVSSSTKHLSKIENNSSCLDIWITIVDVLSVLVKIVKIQSSRINLTALLKHSQSIIELFFGSGLRTVEVALRENSAEVLRLLKSLQTVTRFLHSICCHSKITNDSLVAANVPAIRAQCERLTLEVKGILISNNIPMECITIAILKNKDIDGNDILSQETVDEDEGDEDYELEEDSEVHLEDDEDLPEERLSEPESPEL